MTLTKWYAVSIAAIAACLLLYRLISISLSFLVARFQTNALKHFSYPLLIRRRYWGSVTRLQGALIGSYITINGFCMGLGIRNSADLMARSGIMASINLIPLFLGGRTSIVANFLGVSLHTYYLAHHWVGRVVIIQGLLHAGLALASGKPWTYDSSRISGISAASALALILLLSLFFVRRLIYEFFLSIHLLLAFVAVLALLKHLGLVGPTKSIFPIVCLSLWGCNNILRFWRIAFHNIRGRKHRPSQASITHFFEKPTKNDVSATRLTVRLSRKQKVRPGEYFYIFLSGMETSRRFQSHPHVALWWDYPMEATTLSFLIQPQGGISAELAGRKSIGRVILDGPYGKDLHLEKYETVILVARGIGIAGILPYARHMTDRRVLPDEPWAYQYRRGLITRKIDVYWVLEDNSQEDWVSDWIKDLYDLDAKNLILTFSCFYPHKKTKPPPVPVNPHWRFIYQQDALPIIEGLMVKQVQRSPGKTKVAVCGSPGFSGAIRDMTLKTMNEYRDVEFVETEFRPHGVRQAYPGIRVQDEDDIEMAIIKGDRRRRLAKASRLADESASTEKLRPGDRPGIDEDGRRLVKTHSGVMSKLETLDEETYSKLRKDQLEMDLEHNGGRNVNPKEIV